MKDSSTPESSAPQHRRKRRWWLRIALLLFVLFIALVLIGPIVAAPIVRGIVVETLGESLNGKCFLEELSFSLGGSLHAGGFALEQEDGSSLASLESLEVEVDVLPLLSRQVNLELTAVGFELYVRRDAEGSWNFERVMKEPQSPAEPADPDSDSDAEPIELPGVRARIALSEGRIVIETPEGNTSLEDVSISLEIDDLATRSPFELTANVRGPGGEGGSISVTGEVALTHEGALGVETIEALIEIALDGIALAELQPVLALVGDGAQLPRIAGGALGVRSKIEVARGPEVEVGFELQLDGLVIADGETTLGLEALRVSLGAVSDASGDGRHELVVELPGLSKLTVKGETRGMATGAGEIEGELEVSGDLKGLLELARGFVEWMPGRELSGGVGAKASWDVTLGDAISGTLLLSAGMEELSLRDEAGAALDLGGMENAKFELSADLDLGSGRFDLQRFELDAGPIRANAHAGVSGLGAEDAESELSLTASEFSADIDLDRLEGIVRQVVELGDKSFGGRITMRAGLRDEAGQWVFDGNGELADLRLDGFGEGPVGPLAASMEFGAHLDPKAGGRSTIDRFRFDAGFLKIDGSGELTDIADPERMTGEWTQSTRFLPALASEQLGPLFAGYSLDGAELVVTKDVSYGPNGLTLRTELESKRMIVHGPELGEAGLELDGMKFGLRMKAAADGASADIEMLSFQLGRVVKDSMELSALGMTLADLRFDRAAGKLEVKSFELTSELAAGGGAFTVTGLTEKDAKPEWNGRMSFAGAYEEMLELARSFAPDELPELTGNWELSLDASAGLERAEVKELVFTSPGVQVRTHGSASGYADESATLTSEWTIEPKLELGELTAWAAPLLDGMKASGRPLEGSILIKLAGEEIGVVGGMSTQQLTVSMPAAEEGEAPIVVEQRELELNFDLTHDATREGGRLDLKSGGMKSTTLAASASGVVTGTSTPNAARADLDLTMNAQLERLMTDFGAFLEGVPVSDARGALAVRAKVAGDRATVKLTGNAQLDELEIVIPSETDPDVKGRIAEKRLTNEFAMTYIADSGRLDIERFGIDCETIRGQLSGQIITPPAAEGEAAPSGAFRDLTGNFTYVPDRLDAWLRPYLPGKLSGAQREPLSMNLSGEFGELDVPTMLRALRGTAQFAIGHYSQPGLDVTGKVSLKGEGDSLRFNAALGVNGGTINALNVLDLRLQGTPEAPLETILRMEIDGVAFRPELAPLLAHLHPAFLALKADVTGSVSGSMTGTFVTNYNSPITQAVIDGGWEGLSKKSVNGSGNLEIGGVSLASSPLVSGIVELFGTDAAQELALSPVSFEIQNGRLGYRKPWQWTIGGSPTSFGGTIGLDGTLAMQWKIPVTQSLVQRHSFLKYFEGETLEMPIAGTLEAPSLSVRATMNDLAKKALQRELESQLGDQVPDLGDLLGGGGAGGGQSAGDILKRADQLYSQGKKAEAAALYRKLREDHKATTTYLFNKNRIKNRSQGI